jgi:hypothetical protein
MRNWENRQQQPAAITGPSSLVQDCRGNQHDDNKKIISDVVVVVVRQEAKKRNLARLENFGGLSLKEEERK